MKMRIFCFCVTPNSPPAAESHPSRRAYARSGGGGDDGDRSRSSGKEPADRGLVGERGTVDRLYGKDAVANDGGRNGTAHRQDEFHPATQTEHGYLAALVLGEEVRLAVGRARRSVLLAAARRYCRVRTRKFLLQTFLEILCNLPRHRSANQTAIAFDSLPGGYIPIKNIVKASMCGTASMLFGAKQHGSNPKLVYVTKPSIRHHRRKPHH